MFVSHLHPQVAEGKPEQVPTRDGYGEGLKEGGAKNPQVVALSADLTESTRTLPFAEAFPERFVQVGIAEQNMASVASGMAAMGKIPFIASYAMFSPGRSWEQVRTTIAYNESNVKIIGAHAGISVGPDGATHQAIEDIALMRVIPNMVVINPCDVHEAKRATLAAIEYDGPVYIRIGREKTPVVTSVGSPFVIGKGEVYYEKNADHKRSVAIVVNGTLLYSALAAAVSLEREGVGVTVANVATVKPLDTELLDRLASTHDAMVTVEEHQVAGGFGSAVAEHVSASNPKRIIRVGVLDQFGQSGTPNELYVHYKMDTPSIIAAVRKALA